MHNIIPSFCFIISCYNKSKIIEKHINLLKKSFIKKHKIIVVDDKSTDNTLEILNKIENIEIISNEENKGWGYSNNKALEMVNEEYVVFMDADILIGTFGWIENWYFFQRNMENIGESGELHYCSKLYNMRHVYEHLSKQSWIKNNDEIYDDFLNKKCSIKTTSHIGGSFKIFNTSLIKKINGFSNHSNPVCVEVEISIKVKAFGYKLLPYRMPFRWIILKSDNINTIVNESQRMNNLLNEQTKQFEEYNCLGVSCLNWLNDEVCYFS